MRRIAAILSVLAMMMVLCVSGAADEQLREYGVEENRAENKTTYPYVVHTEYATWYLAGDDIALLGEDAFFEGLHEILQYQDADFADARNALSGFITEEAEPIDIYTDFCAKAGMAEIGGAYYNERRNFIKVFFGWDTAKDALLHEYTHYLTLHCTGTPVKHGFFAEGMAEYVSSILCRNRMRRDRYGHLSDEEKNFFMEHGAWDEKEDCLDPRLYCFGTAEAYATGQFLGQEFFSTADVRMVRTAEIQQNPTAETISHFEAACMMAYLAETFTQETVFSHMDMDPAEMEQVFGKPFADLYENWKTWNTAYCSALGLSM